MRIYIIEDDITVISILEDIVEQNDLGTVCGDTADAPPDLEGILAADPDLILVDLLMPGKDGIQVVRELKEGGSRAKFIMISQVSAKEMVARAYSAGVDFFPLTDPSTFSRLIAGYRLDRPLSHFGERFIAIAQQATADD